MEVYRQYCREVPPPLSDSSEVDEELSAILPHIFTIRHHFETLKRGLFETNEATWRFLIDTLILHLTRNHQGELRLEHR